MKIYYGTSPGIKEPHVAFKLEHIAKTRRLLLKEVEKAGGLEKSNRNYLDGINHVLDTIESAILDGVN